MKKDIEWLKAEIEKQAIVMDKGYIYTGDLTYLINQLDEPESLSQELPVIPKYVAEWITKHRDTFDLYPMLKRLEKNSSTWERTYKWYRENTHTFVNAFLAGEYEVEEEPLYYALVKGHELLDDSSKYWSYSKYDSKKFFISYNQRDDSFIIVKDTKNRWNELGINDSNADFVKVDEELN